MNSQDILASFAVVSLLMKIPLDEVVWVVNEVIDPRTTRLVEVCLFSTFFSFQGEFYE